jgi:hypothetical protein
VQIGGRRRNVAAFDATTGALLPWNPSADDSVYAVAANTSAVYLGGSFAKVGGVSRRYLASVDSGAGKPMAWDPEPDQQVSVLALAGTTLYVGGAFEKIAGESRHHIAAFDTTTGSLLPWSPAVGSASKAVDSIVVGRTTVYLDGTPFDRATGAEKSWPKAPGLVFAASDRHVFATTRGGWGGLVALPPPP